MNRKKDLKAFSLLELIVVMAIVAVILGLAIFGISAAQRGNRDTQRRAALNNINIGIQDYNANNRRALRYIYFDATEGSENVLIGANTATCAAGYNCPSVPLEGVAIPSQTEALLDGPMSGSATTSSLSKYCFSIASDSPDGYALGVQLENGSWFHITTTTCNTLAAAP